MDTLHVNGQAYQPHDGQTVLELVATWIHQDLNPDGTARDGARLGVAVAGDATVVPRSQWATTPVAQFESIDIVTAVQGG